jgi:hypothetical protein
MLTQFYALGYNPYNLLTTNQYGVETDLTGWAATGGTLARETGGHIGTYCAHVTTSNATAGEGLSQSVYSQLLGPSVGLNVSASAYCKGTGTVVVLIYERDSAGASLGNGTSATYTLTGTYTKLSHVYTVTNALATQLSMKILTPTKQLAEIYSDSHQICPVPILQAENTAAPLAANRYGMYITQTSPTTIKSDSIPASEKTGIGVYDQMQAPEADNGFLSLAREWFRPTWQKTILQSEV